jgi:DNA polymerase-4
MSAVSFDKLLEPSRTLRWLYIDFNSYFASVEQQLCPELRGKPVAVLPVMTEATCAIAASYEAKAFGVKTGTPVYEAKRLCPGLICVLGRHEHYIEFHHRIQDEVERHIPIDTVASIDEVACRLMDNENSEERATEIAGNIKRGLARNIGEYVRCSIGIAPNRYLAKVATDLKKPDGLTILRASDLPDKLLPLKLRDLPGIGYNMEHRLRMQGIGDLQALWNLNPRQMYRAWGSLWGERMWYYLRGVELADVKTDRRTVGHSHVLAPELRPPEKARLVARRLALKCASRLRRMGYYATTLSLSLRIANGPRIESVARCWRAQDSMTFLHMLDHCWSRLMQQAGKGAQVKKVSVTLFGLVEAGGLQPELFAPEVDLKERERHEKVSRALDKINHRFGRDSVSVGMLPSDGRSFSGTKIAFTRIPDVEEFLE